VKCRHILYKGDCLWLAICACYSWKMALNVDLDYHSITQDWKGTREKVGGVTSKKAYITNGEISC
jgi:hypothetical protein